MTDQLNREIIKPKSEKQWLAMREPNLNSTDVAALYGLSPYTTEFELFHQKKGSLEDNFVPSQRTIIGQAVEAGIAKAFTKLHGVRTAPFKPYIRDEALRVGSSFDFEVPKGDYEGYLVEIKNVDYLIFRDQWLKDDGGQLIEAPQHIELQAQHEAMMADRPGVIILACVGGNSLHWVVRDADSEMQSKMLARIGQFWQQFDADEEPVVDYQRDADALMALYNHGDKTQIMDATGNEEIEAHLRNYQQWGDEIKKLQALRTSAKAELLPIIGEHGKVIINNEKKGRQLSLSCGTVKETPPTIITKDMVGDEIGGRKGYRLFRLHDKELPKPKEKK